MEISPDPCFFSQNILASVEHTRDTLSLRQQSGGVEDYRRSKLNSRFIEEQTLIVGHAGVGQTSVWGLSDDTSQGMRGNHSQLLP